MGTPIHQPQGDVHRTCTPPTMSCRLVPTQLDRSTSERCRPTRLKTSHEQKWFAANQPMNTKHVGVDEEVVADVKEVVAVVVDPSPPPSPSAQCTLTNNKTTTQEHRSEQSVQVQCMCRWCVWCRGMYGMYGMYDRWW